MVIPCLLLFCLSRALEIPANRLAHHRNQPCESSPVLTRKAAITSVHCVMSIHCDWCRLVLFRRRVAMRQVYHVS
ncbi:hypothetical protein F4678DRAFT_435996 [Xylaria arbuscula]|nr:hypothetical protein F4678DRAFT_435996 [Xylaria arbuscula]